MPSWTPSSLLDWLSANQLLRPDQVEELRSRVGSFATAQDLARELVRRDLLTPFQINHILQDKGDELILGSYRLLQRLGEGAMGQVFKAWNVRMQRVVALKMIHKEHVASVKAVKRFSQELETASKLDHPNIVLVRDADVVVNRPFMVMDYIEGTDLSRLIKRDGPLPVAEACDYVRQAALGLQHAYERDVVHRDIKPSNLLLARGPGGPVVKILDFGLARFESERDSAARLTQVGNILGTADYISPEQAEDATRADIRADIYSLGCTLFYLLTAQPAFKGTTLVQKLSARMLEEPPPVRQYCPEAPPDLEKVLQKIMARKVDDRYQTPVEVATALAPFTGKEAPPPLPLATPVSVASAPLKLAQPATAGAGQAAPLPLATPARASQPPLATPAAPPAAAAPADIHEMETVYPTPGLGVKAVPPAPPSVGGSSPFSDMEQDAEETPSGQSPRSRPASAKSRRMLGVALGAGGLLLCVILGWFLFSGPGARRGYPADARLYLQPLRPMVLREGKKSTLIVQVEREKFQGPVKIVVKNPPSGITPAPLTIPENKNVAELRLTASFGTADMQAELTIQAVADNLQAETKVHISVTKG